MSAPRKENLARGWSAVERLLDEDADRVAAMSDEEFAREMRAVPERARVPSVDETLARAKRIASERAARARDPASTGDAAPSRDAVPARDAVAEVIPIRRRGLWLLAAAVGVLAVLAIALLTRPRAPDPRHPDDGLARAAQLRREATAACEENRVAECESKLDDARDLDPAGEARPEVQAARARIADSIAREAQTPEPQAPEPPPEGKPRRP